MVDRHGVEPPTDPVTPAPAWNQPPRTLNSLAASASLSMSDVALLSEATTSTLSRLWFDSAWLDRISGTTLQGLLAVIPGLMDYVSHRSRTRRIDNALRQCVDIGLEVSATTIDALVGQGSGIHVATALAAAASVVHGDHRSAYARLTRCWGAQPDAALDALFSSGPEALLSDPSSFVTHAARMVETNVGNENSLHRTVGSGILVHKLTKMEGAPPIATSHEAPQRSSAFSYRSAAIGVILNSDDVAESVRYRSNLESSSLLQRNEIWSMASYSTDLIQTSDFSIPSTLSLSDTANIVLSDVNSRSEAYLHYLITAAIPAVLAHDPKFGHAKSRLIEALKLRIDHGISDRNVLTACSALLKKIS